MNDISFEYDTELLLLCQHIKELIKEEKLTECTLAVSEAMKKYPHAPHPHNLMGILSELEGDRLTAMKHFRAAWALDPTYMPSRINLDRYGSFYGTGPCAFDEQDCLKENDTAKIVRHVPIRDGRVNVIDVPIHEAAPSVGKKLWEIELPNDVIIGCIQRREHNIIPRGETQILAGDTLILIAQDNQDVLAVRNLTGHDIW